MDIAQFWNLIDRTRIEAKGDVEKQVELLVRKLSRMPVEEIVSYDRHFVQCMYDAYDNRLWAAACVIEGMGDDDFSDFRAWLISRGQSAYARCLADPEELITLVETPDDQIECERMNYVAANAYEAKTGRNDFTYEEVFPDSNHPKLRNSRLKWTMSDGEADPQRLSKFFPKLWARFGEFF